MKIAGGTVRAYFPILAFVAAFFGIWEAHCAFFSSLHLGKGDAASAAGKREPARLEWETAASRPAPWNPYAREAMGRLVSMEKELESEGRHDEALRLCFSIRGISESTAGYRSYYAREKELAVSRIPLLADRIGTKLSPERYTLFRPLRAGPAHLAVFSFAGFVLAAAMASRSTERARIGAWCAVAAVLFAAWIVFLRFA